MCSDTYKLYSSGLFHSDPAFQEASIVTLCIGYPQITVYINGYATGSVVGNSK